MNPRIWPFPLALLLATFAASLIWLVPNAQAYHTFDASELISDGEFQYNDSMSVSDIQAFLDNKGGVLKNYSDGNRSAAQIIWDAAHGKGNAAGTVPGTSYFVSSRVNPRVLLSTLQKEQSLITRKSADDATLDKAMGYGCPDGGSCNPAYKGFTKQVEYAAWQLQWNYERAQGKGYSDYQVGQTYTFSDVNGNNTVTLKNRATAALYRYTPHVYNGNYNFWVNYHDWFLLQAYEGQYLYQSPYISAVQGSTYTLRLGIKNVGSSAWQNYGSNPVHLGVANPITRRSRFQDGSWVTADRPARMKQTSIQPGETAEFEFTITVPQGTPPGTYREYFNLVSENFKWFDKKTEVYWDITVADPFKAQMVSMSAYPTLSSGQSTFLEVTMRNVGSAVWQNYGPNPVQLGLENPRTRTSRFHRGTWLAGDRPTGMQQQVVRPGDIATFRFEVGVSPGTLAGTYREYFRLVVENHHWFGDDGLLWWDIIVR